MVSMRLINNNNYYYQGMEIIALKYNVNKYLKTHKKL